MKAVDLFAGAGGFTEGAVEAGVEVVWAANHWPLAVETHELNHPDTDHECQDLRQADWGELPPHDIMLAAPSCKGNSRARGKDRPQHEKQRCTAWAVIDCAEYHRQQCLLIENVPEMKNWTLYPIWIEALKQLGYSVVKYVVDAADHGVPQNRERLFHVCTRSKKPIQLRLPRREHVPIKKCIEWSNFRWSMINRPNRSKKTLKRIAAGRQAFGERFLAPYYGRGSGETGRSLNRPVGTITTIDRWAVIDGDRMRMLQPPEIKRAMAFRQDYQLPANRRHAIMMLGNAVCPPVATDLLNEIQRVA